MWADMKRKQESTYVRFSTDDVVDDDNVAWSEIGDAPAWTHFAAWAPRRRRWWHRLLRRRPKDELLFFGGMNPETTDSFTVHWAADGTVRVNPPDEPSDPEIIALGDDAGVSSL